MTRVTALHREARDGANRCLLSYTLERTSEAEALCADLLALVEVALAGGEAIERTQALAQRNEELTTQVRGPWDVVCGSLVVVRGSSVVGRRFVVRFFGD